MDKYWTLDWILNFTRALSLYQKFISYQKYRIYVENGSLWPHVLPVLMSSIETDEADRSTVSRAGTEPVLSSLPPTRSAVMVPAPALHQNLFPY